MSQALHVLSEVRDPPRPGPGRLRSPTAADRPLLVEWMRAFAEEAGTAIPSQAERLVDERIAYGGLFLWDDSGPVPLLGATRPVGGVVRLGPVDTPVQHRRRGYASSAVAALSRLQLSRGNRRCMLYTDLANPTSNKIYAGVGYARIADWEEHTFI
jgi:predicted GNAT family acetyltransferase